MVPEEEIDCLCSEAIVGNDQDEELLVTSASGESNPKLDSNNANNPNNGSAMSWDGASITLSIALFIIAGILEVGGGYMVWLGIREKRLPYVFIPAGALVLVAYGVVPTFQPVDSFGRVFAVYGGFFIVLSYLWAYVFDGFKPDVGDYVGAAIALVGVCITWFWPR